MHRDGQRSLAYRRTPDYAQGRGIRHLAGALEKNSTVTIIKIRPIDIFAAHSITVDGADAAQENQLRQTREQLRTATGIRPASFDTYTFHITLAYLARWLDKAEAESVITLSATLVQQLQKDAPTIELGSLEFCHFDDMHHFELVKRLGT